ncbi:hypothetical protein F5Y07DRAFT_366683 [Xylaria sp. FL0933]|nr:hypothetical protein F5Y07DRAFT_366683 [Xylaria sp. FL0933]
MSSVINVLARNCRTAAPYTSAASGITSLIKAMIMLRKNIIRPHVGIKGRINRNLPDLAEFNTRLCMSNTPFLPQPDRNRHRRILVNNFDAAGGNTKIRHPCRLKATILGHTTL